jgi:hypothetical protein
VEILGIGKIKFLRGVNPRLQRRMVDTADPLRIGMFFEDVLLKLLEEQRVIVIIL